MKTVNSGARADSSRFDFFRQPPLFFSSSPRMAFCAGRINHALFTVDSLPPYDEKRDFRWTKGELRADGYVYGARRPDGNYDYELTYYPAEDVLRVVEKLDLDYIARLKQEGKLLNTEPNLESDLTQYQEPRGGHRRHTLHDEIMQLLQLARHEVEHFGKELSEKERLEKEHLEAVLERLLREEFLPHCACAKSGKIMLDPVIASDGETYEREEIEDWFETHKTSPKTGEVLGDKRLVPNKAIARQRAALLKLSPALLTSDQFYLSIRLKNRLLQAVHDANLEEITEYIMQDERLLTYPLRDSKPLLVCALESRHLPLLARVLDHFGARFETLPEVKAGGMALFDKAIAEMGTPGARLIANRLGWDAGKIQMTFVDAVKANDQHKVAVCLDLGANVEHKIAKISPLHHAIAEGTCALAQLLVERQADRHVLDDGGRTALHHAIDKEDADMATLLCKTPGSTVNVDHPNREGLSALHMAITKAQSPWVTRLLEWGADRSVTEPTHRDTALLAAVRRQERDIVPILLQGAVADVLNAEDKDHLTAIQVAFNNQDYEMVRSLVAADVNLEMRDSAGNSALLRAVQAQRFDLVQLMVERRPTPADLQATNNAGRNALHCCAAQGQKKQDMVMAEYLVEQGINGHAVDHEMQTAEDLAKRAKYGAMTEILRKKMLEVEAKKMLAPDRQELQAERGRLAEQQRQLQEQMAEMQRVMATMRGGSSGQAWAPGLFAAGSANPPPAPPPAYEEGEEAEMETPAAGNDTTNASGK